MRILKIIHGYPPNYNAGSEVYSQSICNEFSKNHEVFVFTRQENPYLPDFYISQVKENDSLNFYFVNMPRGKDGFRHTEIDTQFKKILHVIKPDVAHIGHINHLSTGLIDELVIAKIPIIYTLHDFWLMCPRGQFLQRNFSCDTLFELCNGQENRKCALNCYNAYFSGCSDFSSKDIEYWSSWIGRRMNEVKKIIEKVDLFIAPSKYLMNRFIADMAVPDYKIIYLDYGFPVHYLTPTKKPATHNTFTFGYIGTHIPSKGINLLIKAFNTINVNCKLIIWGWKDQQSTKALSENVLQANNQIEFKGEYINKNLADEVFTKVDCIVVPSIWAENSPLVIHEAQACHIPVITADYGGMIEYVQHKFNGLLFKHRDVNSLSLQMQWAVTHPSEMAEFGKRGYLYTSDGKVPSIEEHCKQLISLYNQTISAHAK